MRRDDSNALFVRLVLAACLLFLILLVTVAVRVAFAGNIKDQWRWTIFFSDNETVLQYVTAKECYAAIDDGLPYRNLPPKNQIHCRLARNLRPILRCDDGSEAFGTVNETPQCRPCMDDSGHKFTSSLCEAHGLIYAGEGKEP